MKQLHENLWITPYPLSVLGTDHGRTVTTVRLPSGKLIVHSMAPFTPSDVAQIRALGEPAWLVEAMILHDTYARQGHDTFPDTPFLGPEGFGDVVKFSTLPLLPAPAEWNGEIELIELQGERFGNMPCRLSRSLTWWSLLWSDRFAWSSSSST